MSINKSSNNSSGSRVSSPPSTSSSSSTSATSSSQETPKEQGSAPKAQPSAPVQSSLAQMVRSMSQSRYSNWEGKQKQKEEWSQLSKGSSTSAESSYASESSTQKSSPMAALFLSVGGGFDDGAVHEFHREEDMKNLQHSRNVEESLEHENFEDRKAQKAFLMGGARASKSSVSVGQAGGNSSQNQDLSAVQGAKKKQSVMQNRQSTTSLSAERTFGFVALGSTDLLTPAGKEIRFLDKDLFQIHHPGGAVDEIQLRGNQVIITDESGESLHKTIPVSLILSDGTKLTIGPDCEVAITNRELFAHISQGRVEKNNRSVLSGGITDELMAQGLSEQDAIKRLDDAGSQILHLVPDDIHADDLADFNAADLDYTFRDGEYLVRSSEGTWTTDPAVATESAREAMREARLSDTIWRMGIFCIEAEEILSDLLMDQHGLDDSLSMY